MARKRKLEKDIRVPLEYGLDLLGGRWNSRIVGALCGENSKRYGDLRQELEGISDTALSLALKDLVEAGLIDRQVYDAQPPHVEYSLTEKGESLLPILRSICAWAVRYYPDMTESALPKCKKCPIFLEAQNSKL